MACDHQSWCVLNCESKHSFHRDCILKWLKTKNTCPICRSTIREDINIEEFINDFIHFAINERIIEEYINIESINIFRNLDNNNLFKILLNCTNGPNYFFILNLE